MYYYTIIPQSDHSVDATKKGEAFKPFYYIHENKLLGPRFKNMAMAQKFRAYYCSTGMLSMGKASLHIPMRFPH